MTYTPINWQTGDTISAEKMNKMDNGWGLQEAQLFSETVTTSRPPWGGTVCIGMIPYHGDEYPSVLHVTFNGTEYECNRDDSGLRLEYAPNDASNAFYIVVGPDDGWMLYTPTAGTYSISAIGEITQVSSDFDAIVKKCSNAALLPLPCIGGVTTADEIGNAFFDENRLLYVPLGSDNDTCHIITGVEFTDGENATITLLPTPSSFTATITDGVFTINWS